MPITPFRVRITQPGNAPGWLAQGTGERMLYAFGLMVDARMERLTQGMLAHMPRSSISRSQAPHDALLVMASDRLITPGITENDASLAAREQRTFDDWQLAGLPRGVMASVLGALLSYTPEIRTVSTTFDPAGFQPARISSTWTTYAAGADPTLAPVPSYCLAGDNGDWDWDSASPITGSYGSWSSYIIIYSVSPNAWTQPNENWGTGSTYSGNGYYSTVGTSGGIPAYVPTGSYSGSTRAWGSGSTYQPSADGYYSKAGATYGIPSYVTNGTYQGSTNGWGVSVDVSVGQSLAATIAQRKPANSWIRAIIVLFDATLFDPTQMAGGGINPDGTFGQWSALGVGAYVASRLSSAAYGEEVR